MSVTTEDQEQNGANSAELFKKTAVLDEIRREYAKYLDNKYLPTEFLRLFPNVIKGYAALGGKKLDPSTVTLSTVLQTAYPVLRMGKDGNPLDNRNQDIIDSIVTFLKAAESKSENDLTQLELEVLAATKVFMALSAIENTKIKIAAARKNPKFSADDVEIFMQTLETFTQELQQALKGHEAILKKGELAASPLGRMINPVKHLIQFIQDRVKTKAKQESPIILQHKEEKRAREHDEFKKGFADFFKTMKGIDQSPLANVKESKAWKDYMKELKSIERNVSAVSAIDRGASATNKEVREFNRDMQEIRERIEKATSDFTITFKAEQKSGKTPNPNGLKYVQQELGAGMLVLDKLQYRKITPSKNNGANFFKQILKKMSHAFVHVKMSINPVAEKQKLKAQEKELIFNNISDLKQQAKVQSVSRKILEFRNQSEVLLADFPKNIPAQLRMDFVELFNIKPKIALRALEDLGMNKPEQVAHFLHAPGLDKKKVGEVLGEPEFAKPEKGESEINKKYVLDEFAKQFDFKGKDYLSAFREFLDTFRLPGEAQKIDRVVKAFANEFYDKNKDTKDFPFKDADAAYVLAYSVIMLNTDAHNPEVHKKMMSDEFVRNNRGINAGENLPKEFLQAIYKDIKENEIKLKEEHSSQAVRHKI